MVRTGWLALAVSVVAATAAVSQPGDFHALLAANPALDRDPGSILVAFEPGVPDAARAGMAAAAGGRIVQSFDLVPGLCVVEAPGGAQAALVALAGAPGVRYAEPNYVCRPTGFPNDPRFGEQWALHNYGQIINGSSGKDDADIDAPEGWNYYTGDPNFAIAIIDTGVLYTHPDLKDNIWANPGEIPGNGVDDDGNGYIDDVVGWDWVGKDNAPLPSDGHGTRNAGIVGATGNNAVGISGVAWRCKVVCLRFMGPQGGLVSDAIAAIQYCTSKGIKVSNNSWTAGPNYSQPLFDAINAARAAGHLFVCAAGNNGRDIDTAGAEYPASFTLDNMIVAAATNDKDGRWANSNYGAVSVDLGAPGVKILSTTTNNGYNFGNGTSFAAPHVAGAAALVWGANPGWTYAQVRTRLLTSVRPVTSLKGKTVTGGVLNIEQALMPQTPPAAPSNLTALNLGGGKARLDWKDNSNNENKFQIQRQLYSGGAWGGTISINVAANTVTHTDSPGPGVFRYRIRARNGFGDSAWTSWVKVTVN